MNKYRVSVFLDDKRNIDVVKVNNEVFLRHANESVVDFYNERIIPIFWARGLDFSEIYKPGNVVSDDVKNYVLNKEDVVSITNNQVNKIIRARSFNSLEYDEKLYVENLYFNVYGQKFDHYSSEEWKLAQNLVQINRYGDVSKLKSKLKNNKVSEKTSFGKAPYDWENLSNPLVDNDIVGYVLNKLKNREGYDLYNILVAMDDFSGQEINRKDMIDFDNMCFKKRKKEVLKERRFWRELRNIFIIPNEPFGKFMMDMPNFEYERVLDKCYQLLYGSYEYYNWQKDVVNGYWKYLPKNDYMNMDITHRIYVNVPLENLVKFVMELYTRLEKTKVKYGSKFTSKIKRDDQMVIYTDEANCLEILNVINTIYSQKPELFSENCNTCITTAKTGIPGIGVAHEPKFEHTSHNLHMEALLNRTITLASLKYALNSDDAVFKNKLFQNIKNAGYNDSDFYTYINDLINKFETSELILDKNFYDEDFDNAVKRAIPDCNDIEQLKEMVISEIYSNAELYHLNINNIAFNSYGNKAQKHVRK